MLGFLRYNKLVLDKVRKRGGLKLKKQIQQVSLLTATFILVLGIILPVANARSFGRSRGYRTTTRSFGNYHRNSRSWSHKTRVIEGSYKTVKPSKNATSIDASYRTSSNKSYSSTGQTTNHQGFAGNATSGSYTRSQAQNIFQKQKLSSRYRRGFYHQSIITNPWFWLFMINHHRHSRMNNEQYLQGYRAGYDAAKEDKKVKNKKHEKVEGSSSSKYRQGYQDGYKDGYKDDVIEA